MKPTAGGLVAGLALAGCGMGVSSEPRSISVLDECGAPDGPLHPYTQAAELEPLLVGRWWHCSGPAMIDPTEAGIELVEDHTYFKLVAEDGVLVRETGFARQGTWDVAQETPTSVQFDYHPAPQSGNGGYPQFEDGPRKMSIRLVVQSAVSLYVLDPR